ncbi:MAG TPA: MATE family efflux transporter [Bacteroidetes bacterium]|nr:MATE family efflux transporter [Bacteroidota bacterium]
MRLLPKKSLSLEVWMLAGPVVVGMISQTLMSVVDTAMVGRLGAEALAAAGLGGVLSWMILGSLGALYIGSQAVAARRHGEGDFAQAGKVLDNALLLSVVLGFVIVFVLAPGMRDRFFLFSNDPIVVSEGRGYIYNRLLGGLPFMVIMAHRGFFNGVGETKLHMQVAILINSLNVVLNYFLIFGHGGFPRLETAGAGLASALGTTVGAGYFLLLGLNRKRRARYTYYRLANLDRVVTWRIARLALPSAAHSFMVMLGFSVFSALVARLGTVEMAATNVCINVASLSFLPGAGIGIAAATLIGRSLGEKKPDKAEEYGWEALRIGVLFMGLLGLVFIAMPEVILRLFTPDQAVIQAGVLPLRVVGLFQAFDASGMVLSMALEGAGMNRWTMMAEISVNWGLFLPLTYLFAFVFGWGLTGAWTAMAIYMFVFGVVVALKFAGGSWKTVEV